MRVSLNWVKDFVDISGISVEEIAEKLTMSGLEVEGIERKERAEGVVTAKVVSKEKHPNADKLSVCMVDDGRSLYQVVCGAKNVDAGQTIPFARVGAKLPGGVVIKDAKLRGVESKGMICSAAELGLEEESDGIMILSADTQIGIDINEIIKTDDVILELNVTPNRADCLSILGVAREISILFDKDLKIGEVKVDDASEEACNYRYVKVLNETNCPIYLGRIIKGINIGESPLWIQNRLRSAGMRPINNIVDITNYVMLEYGQPLHAFDLRMVEGGIIVRDAAEGEKIVTLDGKERVLSKDMLVIADEKKVLAVAGIMGGEYSGIQTDTSDVFLECAYFKPESIRMTARRLGMKTDSSYRYERGIDRVQTLKMVDYAAGLIKKYAGGMILKGVLKNDYKEFVPKRFKFNAKKVAEYIGVEISEGDVLKILKKVGISIEGNDTAVSPSYRQDIERWQDLSEEVARIYGYDKIPVTVPKIYAKSDEESLLQKLIREIKYMLADLGYNEVINYSFMSGEYLKRFADETEFVKVKNPISADMDTMRTLVFPGILKNITLNYKNGIRKLKLFEVANVHMVNKKDKLPIEITKLSFVVMGDFFRNSWIGRLEDDLFYYIKSTCQGIFDRYKLNADYRAGAERFLHPGKNADIFINGEKIGFIGEVHPEMYQFLDLEEPIYICEIDLQALKDKVGETKKIYKKLSQYPFVYKDIALIVGKDLPSSKIYEYILNFSELIKDVEIFDRYSGDKIGEGYVSLAFRIYFNHLEKTLTDEETNEIVQKIIIGVEKEFGAKLR